MISAKNITAETQDRTYKPVNVSNSLYGLLVSTVITGTILATLKNIEMGGNMLGDMFGIEKTNESEIIIKLSRQIYQLSSLNNDIIEYYATKLRRESTKSVEMKEEINKLKAEIAKLKENATAKKPGRPKQKKS